MCPSPNGHLLATGRDAKGRKQYRYYPNWRTVRNQTKFDRLIPFAYACPLIREVTDRHLRQRGLSREKLLAVVVRLLDATVIRIGNDKCREQNQFFGLTTLRNHHVEVGSSKICFHFVGKSGVEHEIELSNLSASDHHLSEALRRCRAINLVDQEADILIDLVRLRRDQGDLPEARRMAEEARAVAARSATSCKGPIGIETRGHPHSYRHCSRKPGHNLLILLAPNPQTRLINVLKAFPTDQSSAVRHRWQKRRRTYLEPPEPWALR
ncbi:MAG: hypothetical protein KME14_16855 [Tildeniella torsiva UHER 1998/13D]|nr:hypothetical protein [Tildeniella torsiva UHER 1998/13D]